MKNMAHHLSIFLTAILFTHLAFSQSATPERNYDVQPNVIDEYRQRNASALRSSSAQSNNVPKSLDSDLGIRVQWKQKIKDLDIIWDLRPKFIIQITLRLLTEAQFELPPESGKILFVIIFCWEHTIWVEPVFSNFQP